MNDRSSRSRQPISSGQFSCPIRLFPAALPALIRMLMVCAAITCNRPLHAQTAEATAQAPTAQDFTRMLDPQVAAAVGLTEEQRAQVQTVLSERDASLTSADEPSRAAISAAANDQLSALLTADQHRLFATLFDGRTLRFSFRYQKWADVLDWVAKEADLSLVMDAPPPGTFHYSDSRDYTTTEAIDLLNGWLLTKGFTLVRRDRMLMCLNLKEGLPEGAVPRVSLTELPTRGRFDVVSVLLPLAGRPADTTLAEVKPLLGTYGMAESLPQTQQLLVTDTAANLRIIEQIVQKVPIPQKPPVPPKPVPPPQPELVVYPIQHANPVRAGEVLREIISGAVVVDEQARQISVNAVPADQAKAKTIISQLEANQGPETQPELQLYAIPADRSAELMKTLQLVAAEAQMRLDPDNEKLVVWATAEDHQKIARSLKLLAAEQADGSTRQLHVYPLNSTDPTALSTVLQSLLPTVKMNVDSTSRSLIAVGTLADHEAIRRLIDQLETEGPTTRRLAIYPTEELDTTTVSTLLQTMIQGALINVDAANQRLLIVASETQHQLAASLLKQLQEQHSDDPAELKSYPLKPGITSESTMTLLQRLVPRADISADEPNRRLLISASAGQHAMIEQILLQLESAGGGELPELRFYILEKAGGSSAVTILSAIAPTAQISLHQDTRRLSVVATDSDHQIIGATLQKLEASSPEQERRVLKLYDVNTVQRTRFQAISAGLTSELEGLQILADGQQNELAVWATPTQHTAVAEILRQLQRVVPDEQQPRLIVYPVRKVDPAGVAEVLSGLFPDAAVTTDAKASRLMIHARPALHTIIRAAIEQLDTDVPAETEIKLMVYPVPGISLVTAQTLIGADVPEVTVTADTIAETLIVRGRLKDQQRVADLLDALRSSSDPLQDRRAVSYPAMFSDPVRTTEFFASAFPKAKVVMDVNTRRMTVWATDAEHHKVREAVSEMAQTEERRSLQILDSGNVSRTTAMQVLSAALPDVTFLQTPAENSIMAWLDEQQAAKVQETLQKLMESESLNIKRSLQFYSVRELGPSVTAVLSQSVPAANINPGARSDQLAVVATATEHEQIAGLLKQLYDRRELPPERTLSVHPIVGVDPTAMQQVLRPLLDADVQLTVDSTGRKLFVRATAEKQQRITNLIEQMMASLTADEGRTTRTYVVGAPNADEAQEVLKALYPDATFVTDQDRKLLVATATIEQHQLIDTITAQLRGAALDGDRPSAALYELRNASATDVQSLLQSMYSRIDGVRLSVNEQTGRLVAVATPDQHAAIAELVRQLDQSAADQPEQELAVFRLNRIDGRAIQEALQPLLPKSAVASADRIGGQLFVSAPATDMPRIREIVQQALASSGQSSGLMTKSYQLVPYEAGKAQQVLQALFPDATLVIDNAAEVLVATATPEQHETISTVVSEMVSRGADGGRGPEIRAYPLTVADGNSTVTALQGLFSRRDDVRVSYDAGSRSLVAVARPHQQHSIEQLINQLERTDQTTGPRTLQLYPVKNVDGIAAVQMAEGALHSIDPAAAVSWERQSRQLIVTTFTTGHQRLHELLDQLSHRESREMDVIQLRLLSATSAQMSIDGLFADGATDRDALPLIQADDDSQQLLIRATRPQIEEIRTLLSKMGEPNLIGPVDSATSGRSVRVIAVTGDVEATVQRIQNLWPRVRGNSIRILHPDRRPPDSSNGQFSLPAESLNDATSQEPPPVTVIVGDGQLTLVSDDLEALDQLEALLKAAFSQPVPGGSRNRDFAVYQLRNAGADEVARTLRSVYESRAGLLAFGSVILVPEPRMNAIVVYGGRTDRERIEQLLEVLDTEKLPDSARAFRTQVVTVRYTNATRIDAVLRGVYRAEMVAGGSRQTIEIPSGVPAEVASVLRQINAAASSPLLTVEVQQDTNSLVIKAPQNLLEEVTELVRELDETSSLNRSRGVTLLPLKKTNSTRVMRILGDVLK